VTTRALAIRRAKEGVAHFPPLPDPDNGWARSRREAMKREYRVLVYRARGMTLEEVAGHPSLWPEGRVTRERVRQLESRALSRVRRRIGGPLPCEIPG
jgi:hypothetical protein